MDITSTFQALLTPTIAVAAVYIAWQQWRTNYNKLRYDLFDKRYSVYEAASDFISSILRHGKMSEEAESTFLSGIKGSRFLFSKEVAEYFHKALYSDAVDLETNQSILSELQGNKTQIFTSVDKNIKEEISNCAKEIGRLKKRIYAHGADLERLCAPYLTMSRFK
jgi:peptidoglycan hydrolase CwlO-like protein